MERRLGLMLPRSHVAIVPLRRLGRCRLGPPMRMTVSSKPNSLCELDAVGGAQCTPGSSPSSAAALVARPLFLHNPDDVESARIIGEFLDRKLLTATPVRMLVGGRWQIHLVRLVGQIVDLDHRYRGPRSRGSGAPPAPAPCPSRGARSAQSPR